MLILSSPSWLRGELLPRLGEVARSAGGGGGGEGGGVRDAAISNLNRVNQRPPPPSNLRGVGVANALIYSQ